jgi:2'-5' RNA ligase
LDIVRTFIAVPVVGDAADSVARFAAEISKVCAPVKWVKPGNLHVTLKFLGDLPRSRIPALVEAVRLACEGEARFEVTLRGAGAFPNIERARVLWVGMADGADRLAKLAEAIDQTTIDAGFPRADKAFRPHLTVGRARGSSAGSGASRIISRNSDIELGIVGVEEVHVYSSKLTPSGPIYTSLAKIPLE